GILESSVPLSSVNDNHGAWRRKVIADETFGGKVMNASGSSTAYFLPRPFNSSVVFLLEQILYNIKQEYKRMQKRRHLENSFQQTDPCCSTDAQPHAFLLTGPALPASSPLKKEQPLFTLRQVGMICERLLKEREEKIREEYEEILTTKLAEQYDAFVKFTHDQIMRRYGEQPWPHLLYHYDLASYVNKFEKVKD
uniref:Akirin-2 n=1 Tax=Anser cygnoides TaxID=8845 RepID=A0A8B9E0E3_ANSCY